MSLSSPLCVSSSASPPSAVTPNPNPIKLKPPSILHLSFNQEADCFAVGTTDGFIVYTTDSFGETIRRNFFGVGVGIVQMLFRCNIIALIGAPKYSRNKVMIWDDHLNHCIGELLFRSEVKAVRLRPDRIVVVMLQKIYVYDLSNLKLIHQIETLENPQGLCEISQKGPAVLVCLGLQRGCVRVERSATKCKHIMAHNSSVAFVALMNDGELMATASSKGTLVRVFSTMDGSLLKELRRGSERAAICSISFSSTAQWLAVSSDKGTVHVFSLLKVHSRPSRASGSQVAERDSIAPISTSRLSFIKGFKYAGVLPRYFSSEWSVAQFHLQDGVKHIVAFGHQENTVVVIGTDGRFYRCKFDPVVGGEMTQLESHNFPQPESNL